MRFRRPKWLKKYFFFRSVRVFIFKRIKKYTKRIWRRAFSLKFRPFTRILSPFRKLRPWFKLRLLVYNSFVFLKKSTVFRIRKTFFSKFFKKFYFFQYFYAKLALARQSYNNYLSQQFLRATYRMKKKFKIYKLKFILVRIKKYVRKNFSSIFSHAILSNFFNYPNFAKNWNINFFFDDLRGRFAKHGNYLSSEFATFVKKNYPNLYIYTTQKLVNNWYIPDSASTLGLNNLLEYKDGYGQLKKNPFFYTIYQTLTFLKLFSALTFKQKTYSQNYTSFFFSKNTIAPDKYYLSLIFFKKLFLDEHASCAPALLLLQTIEQPVPFTDTTSVELLTYPVHAKSFTSFTRLDKYQLQSISAQRSIVNSFFFNVHRQYRLTKFLPPIVNARTWKNTNPVGSESFICKILINCLWARTKSEAEWYVCSGLVFLDGVQTLNPSKSVYPYSRIQLLFNKLFVYLFSQTIHFLSRRFEKLSTISWLEQLSAYYSWNKNLNTWRRHVEEVYNSLKTLPRYLEIDNLIFTAFMLSTPTNKYEVEDNTYYFVKTNSPRMYNWRFFF